MRKIKKFLKYILNIKQSLSIKDIDLEYLLWISNLYLRIKHVPGILQKQEWLMEETQYYLDV